MHVLGCAKLTFIYMLKKRGVVFMAVYHAISEQALEGNTKFWEILKIGLIVILYNFDIFGCLCGCIISTRKFSP